MTPTHKFRWHSEESARLRPKSLGTLKPIAPAGTGINMPLEEELVGHLAVICDRYGLEAEHVLRAAVAEALLGAVSSSSKMETIVRAARTLATSSPTARFSLSAAKPSRATPQPADPYLED